METALKRLSELRMLSEDAYTKGVDGMFDATAEAADDEDQYGGHIIKVSAIEESLVE